MKIGRITSAASAALSKPATLTAKVAYSAGDGGSIRAATETMQVLAHWTAFTESMRRLGLPECPRYAHIPNLGGNPPAADDVLSIGDERMLITDVRRSPEGGVYYAGGHDVAGEN